MDLSFDENDHVGMQGQVCPVGWVSRRETPWGYTLEKHRMSRKMTEAAEIGLRSLSVLGFVAMGGLWLIPGAQYSASLLVLKLGLSLFFGILALALGAWSERGLSREIQVDQNRGQVRVVWRNRKNALRLHLVVGFDEIGSVFLRRVPGVGRTRLELRYGKNREIYTLFEGQENGLRDLWHDLNIDLRPAQETAETAIMPTRLSDLRKKRQRGASETRQS